MFIRWLGAFGKGGTLKEALVWENSSPMRERACEEIKKEEPSNLALKCAIGLLFNKTDITRSFTGDVWSLNERRGFSSARLFPTRSPEMWESCPENWHRESFIRIGAKPTGIVLSAKHFKALSKSEHLDTVYDFADETGLTVYMLDRRGQLKKFY